MKAIMAMASNRVIGKNNSLPWPSIKEDFKWFKEFTMGKILIVGHTTFTALPTLKNRNLIVLTRMVYPDTYNPLSNMAFCYRDKNNIVNLDSSHNGELIVIGGAKTYELLLPYITEFYVTHVNGEYEGDTYIFPFEHLFDKQEVIREFDGGHKVIRYSKNI
jgi:dihydrofolate reductase